MIGTTAVLVCGVIAHEGHPVVEVVRGGHVDIVLAPVHPVGAVDFHRNQATIGFGLHLHKDTHTRDEELTLAQPTIMPVIRHAVASTRIRTTGDTADMTRHRSQRGMKIEMQTQGTLARIEPDLVHALR